MLFAKWALCSSSSTLYAGNRMQEVSGGLRAAGGLLQGLRDELPMHRQHPVRPEKLVQFLPQPGIAPCLVRGWPIASLGVRPAPTAQPGTLV